MRSKQFIQESLRTESPNCNLPNPRILHAAMGCVTESGELLDAVKKQLFYGKKIDVVNLKEEAGDILWYLAILFDELDTNFEHEMDRQIEKLRTRFPEKFTEANANSRDLKAERKKLEQEEFKKALQGEEG